MKSCESPQSHLHINWNLPLVGQQIVDLFSSVKWRRKSCHVKLKANFFQCPHKGEKEEEEDD